MLSTKGDGFLWKEWVSVKGMFSNERNDFILTLNKLCWQITLRQFQVFTTFKPFTCKIIFSKLFFQDFAENLISLLFFSKICMSSMFKSCSFQWLILLKVSSIHWNEPYSQLSFFKMAVQKFLLKTKTQVFLWCLS